MCYIFWLKCGINTTVLQLKTEKGEILCATNLLKPGLLQQRNRCITKEIRFSRYTCNLFLKTSIEIYTECKQNLISSSLYNKVSLTKATFYVSSDQISSLANLLLNYLRKIWYTRADVIFLRMAIRVELIIVYRCLLNARNDRELYINILLDVATACYIAAITNYGVIDGVKCTASSITQTAAANTATLGIESAAQVLGNAMAGAAISGAVDVAVSSASIYWAKRKRDKGEISEKEFNVKIKKTVCESSLKFVGGTTGSFIGQALIPVPVFGAFVGGICGSLIGAGIGKGINYGIFDRNANKVNQEKIAEENLKHGDIFKQKKLRGYIPAITIYNECKNQFEIMKFEKDSPNFFKKEIKSSHKIFTLVEMDTKPYVNKWIRKTIRKPTIELIKTQCKSEENLKTEKVSNKTFSDTFGRVNKVEIKENDLSMISKATDINLPSKYESKSLFGSMPFTQLKKKISLRSAADQKIKLKSTKSLAKLFKEEVNTDLNELPWEEEQTACYDEILENSNEYCNQNSTNKMADIPHKKILRHEEAMDVAVDQSNISASKRIDYVKELCNSLNDDCSTEEDLLSLKEQYHGQTDNEVFEENSAEKESLFFVRRMAKEYQKTKAGFKNLFAINRINTNESESCEVDEELHSQYKSKTKMNDEKAYKQNEGLQFEKTSSNEYNFQVLDADKRVEFNWSEKKKRREHGEISCLSAIEATSENPYQSNHKISLKNSVLSKKRVKPVNYDTKDRATISSDKVARSANIYKQVSTNQIYQEAFVPLENKADESSSKKVISEKVKNPLTRVKLQKSFSFSGGQVLNNSHYSHTYNASSDLNHSTKNLSDCSAGKFSKASKPNSLLGFVGNFTRNESILKTNRDKLNPEVPDSNTVFSKITFENLKNIPSTQELKTRVRRKISPSKSADASTFQYTKEFAKTHFIDKSENFKRTFSMRKGMSNKKEHEVNKKNQMKKE